MRLSKQMRGSDSLADPDRQLASPLSRCREDSICYGGRDWWNRRFTDSHRVFCAGYDMNFNLRCLIYPEYLIIVEVTLLHAPAFESDFTLKSRTQTKDNPAFHLCHYTVGVDHSATINGCDDTIHPHPTFFTDRNLCDFSNVGVER